MANLLRMSLSIVFLIVPAIVTDAQNPLTAYPNSYKLALENSDVAVIRVHYGPGEKIGVHDHSKFPTVYVYLSDAGPVRYTHDEIPPFAITRPPVTRGSFRVSPGRLERHTVENLGIQSSDFLRVELKRIPLHNSLHPTRGHAPPTIAPGVTEEYTSPEVSIRRIVCNPAKACAVSSLKSPSLLIAFSQSKIVSPALASQDKQLESGDILWLPNGERLSVSAIGREQAHLLQITLRRQYP